jgi:glutamate/tyrosine decarboxylase-like PLP-dependent enzyme
MSSQEGRRWLRNRKASIEMSGAEFRQAGHRLVDMIADLLDSIRELPVCRDERPSRIRTRLPVGLPLSGAEPAELLEETAQLIFDNSLFNGHPRFFGYITSSAAPLGALADLLAAAVNPNLGGWQLSPMASEIERQAVSWIAEFIGFPKDCGGLFVSGGNAANFNCFLAARASKAPWDLRQGGLAGGAGKMLVYATDEAHTWIQKAVDLFGHGNDAIRKIPTDEAQRADVGSLRGQITRDREQGNHPFLIVASAGTVSTGAIDPIREMAAIARENDLWLHIDGAYGGLAAALPSASQDLKALADADSVAVDPHKWLYSPLEAGCALVRHEQAMLDAFSHRPPYYQFESDDEPETNFYEYGLQNSRGFRALKIWLCFRQVGRSGYVRLIADDIRLAEEIHREVDAHPELEAATQNLSITTFRYVPRDLDPGNAEVAEYLNDLNRQLLARINSSGELYLSNALVEERFLLRTCVVNFRTSLEDVEALPVIVARHGRELHEELGRRIE